jgi:predicted O-methyltransferase YrrM
MSIIDRLKAKALRWAKPLPFYARHIEYSTISSIDDESGRANRRLIEVSTAAIQAAAEIDLSDVSARIRSGPRYPDVWPGEHYRLLAGFVKTLRPRKVIEIGTYQGLSALSLLSSLPAGGEVITVDIVPWGNIDTTVLTDADFADGRLRQVIADLSDKAVFDDFAPHLSQCDLLFVDAPKNVVFESTLLRFLESISLPPNCIVLLDDIRQWNMLELWRNISRPKLDLTSFGHFTGTGVIAWNGKA